jgi:hypothetical protein
VFGISWLLELKEENGLELILIARLFSAHESDCKLCMQCMERIYWKRSIYVSDLSCNI